MTQVSDRNFLGPSQINVLQNMSSSRVLQPAASEVRIIQICQDSSNPAVAIIDYSVTGAFLFFPVIKIIRVDTDTSYANNSINVPVLINDQRNTDVPIDPVGGTKTGTIVVDFGSVIPNFLSAQVIIFQLVMNGTVPSTYGVSIPAESPSTFYNWTKGILPQPVGLSYNQGLLEVQFQYNGTADCSCNLNCISPEGVNLDLTFCPSEVKTVSIRQVLNGDPFNFNFIVSDTIGNRSELNVVTVINVDPVPPVAYTYTVGSVSRVEVSLQNISQNGATITNTEYQIIKFDGSVNNYSIWKDWSSKPWNRFIDSDVIPGRTYGYAVRYKGKFNDVSNVSPWAVVIA